MAEGGQQFGKYRIIQELGAGGFATVYKAVDTTLDREVALKILHPPLLTDRRFVQNFRLEAKTLAALRHPHIITVYEVGEVEGRLFIAMDLTHGPSLAQSIAQRGRIRWNETLALLKPVCEALDYAHGQKVVHRDLKPANLLLDAQRGALLTDFGFARLMAENTMSMSMSGGIVGTPGYIAPEVWELNAASPPVDIYALGCIVYEMLTGDVLFKGQTPIQAMRAHDRGPQLPNSWPDDVPAKIATGLAKALARDPADRYASAGALWQALNELESQAQTAREAAQRAEATKQAAARRAEETKREAEQRAALAAQWRAEAERALSENKVTAAKMALGRWRAVAPDDPAIRDAQERLERLTAPAQRKVASQPEPIAPATMASARPTLAKQPESDRVSPAPVKQEVRWGSRLVTYSVLLILIAIVVIGILTLLGGKVSHVFTTINSGLDISTVPASLSDVALGSSNTIRVVSSLPRTGSSKGQTDTIVNAINQRLEQDKSQACNGQFTLKYDDLDDATAAAGKWDPTQEANNANKAAADPDVMVYIGTFNSGAAKVSIPILNQAGLVMISPANTYPGLTKPGKGEAGEPDKYYPTGKRNYTRVVPADDLQGAAAAKWAKELGVKSVYILHDTETYGKGIADVFRAVSKTNGFEEKGYEGIDKKAQDYKALGSKIKDANPDLVYFGGITQNNAGLVLKDLRSAGYTGKFMGPDGIYEQAFLDAAGDAAEGAYLTFGGVPPGKLTGKGKEWYDAYKAKFKSEPEVYAVYGYEAANVALAAINKVCAKERAAILGAVFAIKDFDGVTGKWSFDANGDTSLTGMSGVQVKGGKFDTANVAVLK